MPDAAFPFQQSLIDWAIRKGRAAIFADCGLGKTLMFLTWAENAARHTGKPTLILTPLAVSSQTVEEGQKFGIEVIRSQEGLPLGRITVTNYERLHLFNSDDFGAVVCDESSILKNFNGARRSLIIEFM
ncbi:MAG: helicase, partial [Gammaproteobacteria bacterium]